MSKEKSFQDYFMKVGKPLNYHRIALINGNGFPDVLGFHGERHSLVELKDLVLGKRGDRKLLGLFKKTQIPWYVDYMARGGSRLFVAFRVTDWDGTNKRYGLWQLSMGAVMRIDTIMYSEMSKDPDYKEYSSCKEMIQEIEYWEELS